MAIMRMIALTLVGPYDEMENVAREMVLYGGFQPLPIDFLLNDRNIRARINTDGENPYDELLSEISMLWRICGEQLPPPEPMSIGSGFTLSSAREEVKAITKKLDIWRKRKDVIAGELDMLKAVRVYMKALANLKMNPNELADCDYVMPHFGRVMKDNFTRLIESTMDAPIVTLELSKSTDDNVWALAFAPSDYAERTQKMLDAVYFKEYSVKDIAERFTGSDPMKQIENRIALHERAIQGLSDSALKILRDDPKKWSEFYSRLYTMQRVYDVCKGRGEISGMYVLSGWIPFDTYDTIKKMLEEEAPRTAVLFETERNMTNTGIRVPTALSNNKLVRSFQFVVQMYSVPSYGEIDPSPFVAFTFILFFGFMFGDIGHGLMLFLITAWLGKKKIMNHSLAYVMKYASCSSLVFGALYGSAFGFENPDWALWISPMHDISLLFVVAIIMGVLMISLGMVLNMIVRFRQRDFGQLLFDGQGLAGLFVYWGSAIAIFVSVKGYKLAFPVSYLWYTIAAVFILTFFRDVLARTLLNQKVEHAEPRSVQIIEVIHSLMNYFANTASFIRLGAFALNHVALSTTVLLLSNMLGNMPGGGVLKALMIVIGNIFIVGLEGLIVFIQVLRLEYYEFFSKFYKGGGSAFKPVVWGKR